MARWALGIEYDGAAFCGWQVQPDVATVQAALEAALARMAGHPVATVCAGRTDSGVHGTGQVVHFDTDASRPEQAWVRGVNVDLPATVAVTWARQVPDDFHARFSAQWRAYRFLIQVGPVRSALWRDRATWVHWPLDLDRMADAAQVLIGQHDFTSFRAAECQAVNPVRDVMALSVKLWEHGVQIDIRANAFLQHMVRNIAGALIQVGRGARDIAWLADVLQARDRRLGAATLGPQGLYLVAVGYDDRFGLPSSALAGRGV